MTNATKPGQLGIVLWLASEQTFPAGDLELLEVTFTIGGGPPGNPPTVSFTDAVAVRDVSDSLANSLAASWTGMGIGNGDSDADGMMDWREFVAGTCATNPFDFLQIIGCEGYDTNGQIVIYWDSASGKWYTVYLTTNLLGKWTNVYETLGNGGRKCFTNNGVPAPVFLRLGVESQDTGSK